MSSWKADLEERSCSSITENKKPKCYQQSDGIVLEARASIIYDKIFLQGLEFNSQINKTPRSEEVYSTG
jgi:hypothetical protein